MVLVRREAEPPGESMNRVGGATIGVGIIIFAKPLSLYINRSVVNVFIHAE